jgi:DNA primase
MALVDRAEVLARIDLGELASEICGPPVGRGRSARWHCPNPDHPDQHPSMSLYNGKHGQRRWKCHACGEGGTAVDLLMITSRLDAGQALRELASRAGLHPAYDTRPVGAKTVPARPAPATRSPAARLPSPAIERLVAQTAELLWQPAGDGARGHLLRRGLTEQVVRANRVGFDPGPRRLPRPRGLPYHGPGIVYPVLDRTGVAIYYQLRYLDPSIAATRKYDQPVAELAPNPKLALIRAPTAPRPGPLVVCEGMPDALTAVHSGLPAVAVLGVAHAGADSAPALAALLAGTHPASAYLIAFDADPPGTTAAHRLAAHLALQGATVARVAPPPDTPDINAWWQAEPAALTRQLIATAQILGGDLNRAALAVGPPGPAP